MHYVIPELAHIPLPRMASVRQDFPHHQLDSIEHALHREFTRAQCVGRLQPGTTVALAVGSRGIANLARIVALAVKELRRRNLHPFIVPAMGSHGGATAEGQQRVLAAYGIFEETVRAPIVSSMQTVQIGNLADGTPIHIDKAALSASAIIPINRIKLHTSFRSAHGSGLLKMLVIGLGKQQNATAIHRRGVYGLRELIPEAATLILKHAPIPFGIAIVEDAHDQTALIRIIPAESFPESESSLLATSEAYMPKLPVTRADVLVVDEMGKNISGTGMDTNIIGRLKIQGEAGFDTPRITRVVVLGITEASAGNAIGLGLADLTTRRVIEKIDYHSFYVNVLTSTFVERGKTPIACSCDKEAIQAAVATCWLPSCKGVRLVRIKNTLELSELQVSENLLEEVLANRNTHLVRELTPLAFDKAGNLTCAN